MLVINPDECIDCALCEPECPVNTIYAEDELPENQTDFIELNKELSESWPNITETKLPPEDADLWQDKPDKRHMLKKRWPTK